MFEFFILVNLTILLPIIIYGIILAFFNKKNVENLHTKKKWWIYTTLGIIGTPIHELSHLIFNLLFFHKVKEVALYRPIKSKKDGILGYVNFSYKENSLYQNIGLFFSGIGPMIGGCLVLVLLMKFLLPNVFLEWEYTEITDFNLTTILLNLKNNIIENLKLLFTHYSDWKKLLIFLILSFSISLHMNISIADLKSAIKGFAIIEILVFIISIMLGLFNLNFLGNSIIIISSYIISFFTIGLIFSLVSLGISYIISWLPE